jgi:hypothetical protein
MDVKEKIDERSEIVFLDLVLETENEDPKVSIQEEHHILHAPLEGNFNLSCAQFESNDHNEFKYEFGEPPLDEHKYFIQYNHDENVAIDSQMAQPTYTKPQEECLHWMKIIYDDIHHFTSNFYDIDFSYEVDFNE